jgi:aminopeptidase
MKRGMAMKPFMDWRREKENRGKLSWTIGLYGTPAMAKAAGMSEKEYWSEIIRACFLDFANPIAKWKDVYRKMEAYRKKLNALPIETLRVTGKDADLTIALGNRRRWMSGRGANIPSFEIFTSPDWRGTEGWIRFSEPLYRYGNLIKGIELEFKKGKVVSARAKKNEKVLQAMLAAKNADKVGEFSLTDRRFSRITTFMANTLYDENVGGPQGNTHIAVGAAYHDCFTGEKVKMKKKDWRRLGFNDSSVHTDMVSTTARTVTARLEGGKDKVIYTDGEFVL